MYYVYILRSFAKPGSARPLVQLWRGSADLYSIVKTYENGRSNSSVTNLIGIYLTRPILILILNLVSQILHPC